MGGGRKHKERDLNLNDDMNEILADPRFAHVSTDPKLRQLPKAARKVKLDSRFASVLTDDKFYEKSTMDPRGRKGTFSTREDLKKFYEILSEESAEDEHEYDDKVEDDNKDDDEDEDEDKDEEEEEENVDDLSIETGIDLNKLKVPSSSTILQESKKKLVNGKQVDENTSKSSPEEEDNVVSSVKALLCDSAQDYARGQVYFSDDSSDDDSSTTDEEDNIQEFDWGQIDHDAVWNTNGNEVEETSRLAVCNMDWDRIKAADLMILLTSFCPRSGSIKKISIYPSEYGKERMKEEEKHGPQELVRLAASTKGLDDDDREMKDLDRLVKGKIEEDSGIIRIHYEVLRQYQRNRLKYYYAVVDTDSVETASVLYKECDRIPYETAGVLLDLRYIPSSMTFDETPHDECEVIPSAYEAKIFTTTALHDARPVLTWDETDPDRKKTLATTMMKAMKGDQVDEELLKEFLASSSDDNDEDDMVKNDEDSDSEDGREDRILKFRALINEIDEKDRKKKTEHIDMEDAFEVENDEELKNKKKNDYDVKDNMTSLTPFEHYLEKRKTKRKERDIKKKEISEESNSDGEDVSVYSDDELPEDCKDLYDDPFFAEELKKDNKKKKMKSHKKSKELDLDKEDDVGLALLVDDEGKEHVNMRQIIENSRETGKNKRRKSKKKVAKEKMIKLQEKKAAIEDDFKVNIMDPRFAALHSSGDFNIDPSHSQFKRTKAMDHLLVEVQKKRVAESFEQIPNAKKKYTEKMIRANEVSALVNKLKSKSKNTMK